MPRRRASLLCCFYVASITDMAAILNSIVLKYLLWDAQGQINMYLPPEPPIIDIETINSKMAAVSAKWAGQLACSPMPNVRIIVRNVP